MKIYRHGLFIILFIIIAYSNICTQPSNQGPYQAGWTSVTLNRDGRNFNAIIYYPSFVEGSEAQIDTIHGPYQTIAFGHGFFMQNSYYISHFKHLASYGFVIIAPQFPDNNHLQLGFDLIHCVNFIKAQNRNSNSRFYNLIDTLKAGLSGHSMGGGASLLAAANDSSITVAAPLAAAETNPSVINVMNQIKGIVFLIAAQNDGITPVNTNQLPMFNNANPVKALVSIKGANHTKFMDTRIWDWTDPNGYLAASEQLRITRKYLTSIFNLFLKEDTSYFKYAFGDFAQSDTSIILQFQLKPLRPLNFNLITPKDTIRQSQINFLWHSSYSLNLNDQIKYQLLISSDEQFSNILFDINSIQDSFYTLQMQSGEYFWKVKAYTSDSTFTYSNVLNFIVDLATDIETKISLPEEFKLEQNFPNPFNPGTKISWQSPVGSHQTIKLFDVLGREIETIVDGYYEAGFHSTFYIMNSTLSSGVYFYQLIVSALQSNYGNAGEFIQTKKMIYLR
mgnify:CR=1 FL=1|uniref:T9SS type A sorting domain-containing protein n=1 Tax=Ignavibacterium album TaxID=591197 RepID=A0A832G8M8_9BACT